MELMHRLGYTRYVAQGGDVGAAVTDTMAIRAPGGLAGIHLNFLRRPPPDVTAALFGGAPVPEGLTEEERAAFAGADLVTATSGLRPLKLVRSCERGSP
jgi:hypothetical protein